MASASGLKRNLTEVIDATKPLHSGKRQNTLGSAASFVETLSAWNEVDKTSVGKRPVAPAFNSTKESLEFFPLDVHATFSDSNATLNIIGLTRNSSTICVQYPVHSIYVRLLRSFHDISTQELCESLKDAVNNLPSDFQLLSPCPISLPEKVVSPSSLPRPAFSTPSVPNPFGDPSHSERKQKVGDARLTAAPQTLPAAKLKASASAQPISNQDISNPLSPRTRKAASRAPTSFVSVPPSTPLTITTSGDNQKTEIESLHLSLEHKRTSPLHEKGDELAAPSAIPPPIPLPRSGSKPIVQENNLVSEVHFLPDQLDQSAPDTPAIKRNFLEFVVSSTDKVERLIQVLCSPEFRFRGHKWNPWDMYRCPDFEFAAKACVKRLGLRPIVPCTLGSDMYSIVPSEDRVSSCGMEVMVQTWPSYKPNIAAEELPPLRVLSFDIEVMVPQDQNWSLKADYEVIQIANYVDIRTATKNELTPSPKPPLRTIFTLDTCDPIPNTEVQSFTSESTLLESWIDWFNDIDPDVIIGYNSSKYDIPTIIARAKKVGIDGPYLSRIQDFKSPDTFIGGRNWDDHTSRIPGRIQLDFFNYIKILISESGEPTQNISLNAASQRFLKQESKEDIAYKEMRGLQLGSAADRKKLGVYCLKDAYLPLLLLDKLNALYKSLTSGTLPWTAFGASLDTKAKLEPRYLVPYIDRKQYREQQQQQKVMEEPRSGSGSARPI